jgi:cholesterol transport system auxiliary component
MMTIIRYLLFVTTMTWLLASCSLLPEPKPVELDRYLLEYTPASVRSAAADAPVLMVGIPVAHGAIDSSRIAYMPKQYGLRYYLHSRWADTPANMLAPLLADAISATGRFQILNASAGREIADLRLETVLTRFYQDFTVQPSVMHVTLRAQLVDLHDQQLIATRVFDIREPAETDDTYGGVQAANRASAALLQQLAQFCVDSAR